MGSGSMRERIAQTAESNPRLGGMTMPFLNKYMAEADEIANMVAFLASDESAFVTAQSLAIDGGANTSEQGFRPNVPSVISGAGAARVPRVCGSVPAGPPGVARVRPTAAR